MFHRLFPRGKYKKVLTLLFPSPILKKRKYPKNNIGILSFPVKISQTTEPIKFYNLVKIQSYNITPPPPPSTEPLNAIS